MATATPTKGPIVVDASAILSQVLVDQDRAFSKAVTSAVAEQGGLVPPLFWYEVRNALVANERRGRLAPEQSEQFLTRLGDLSIEIEDLPLNDDAVALARSHRLTVYDAAYLEVARRRGFEIATTGRSLVRAAQECGVRLFDGNA